MPAPCCVGDAGNWANLYPVTMNVVGGTKTYLNVMGGHITWYKDHAEIALHYNH